MKRRHSESVVSDIPAEEGPSEPTPEFPPWKAFLVQFSRDTDTQSDSFAGRVEHLSSGNRVRFNGEEELAATLRMLLDKFCRTSIDHS